MLAGDGLDRAAELRLVEGAGGRILGVDGSVALLRGAKLVDEIVFAEMQVGDLNEVGLELSEQRREGRGQLGLQRGQGIERVKGDAGDQRRATDLGKANPDVPAIGLGGKVFRGRGVRGKCRFQPGHRAGEIRARESQVEAQAGHAHRQLVARVEGEHGGEGGGFHGGRRHALNVSRTAAASNPQQEALPAEDLPVDLDFQIVAAGVMPAGGEIAERLALGQAQGLARSQTNFA